MQQDNWDQIRYPYQVHIKSLCQAIDFHSEQYIKTADPFHKEQYDRLVECVHALKTYITTQEQHN